MNDMFILEVIKKY